MKLKAILKILFTFLLSNSFQHILSQSPAPTKIYLFPGQGSDERIFSKLKIDSSYDTVYIHYPVPFRKEKMKDYATRLAPQIDTTNPFILIGMSMGGMLATELSSVLHPVKTIIISSASKRSDLPFRYRVLKVFPLYKIFPAKVIKASSFVAQPLFEPDRKKEKKIFKSMLNAKSPLFLKRSIYMIATWNPSPVNVIKIHGTKDHTLPLRKKNTNHIVKHGSHMMTLTQPEEISEIINSILKAE